MPKYFWAEFIEKGVNIFRFDTRIYINSVNSIEINDNCIGAIVGKNPGSAKSTSIDNGIQPINLDGDKLLPTVRNIIVKSYKESGINCPERGYIQVLNLFYLCNPNLDEALSELKKINCTYTCPTENLFFPWVWYVWGGASNALNPFKTRFSQLNSTNHFYYDKELYKVIDKPASNYSFAKHTQGLRHVLVVPYISDLIKSLKK